MAVIAGYTTLLAAIGDEIARPELSAFFPNWVQSWEEGFYRQPKNFGRWMESSLNSTISSSVIAVPSDYLAMKYAYVDGNPASRLDRVSLNQLYGTYPRNGHQGCPAWFARDTTNFVFGPEPDDTYTIKGVYWAKPTTMRTFSSDASTHWIIVNAPELALYGSLVQSAPFLRDDPRTILWSELYRDALKSYRDLIREEDVSGSPVFEVLG